MPKYSTFGLVPVVTVAISAFWSADSTTAFASAGIAAERDVLPVANSPPQPSDTQTPCASYPQFLPSRQLVSLLWRNMTMPALVLAGQC